MPEITATDAPLEVVPTQAGYDRWAKIYDGEDNPLVLLEEKHFDALTGDVANLDIADIGCGTGRHAIRWATEGARVTALDFSEAMLERARAKPASKDIKFIKHDLTQPLPLANAGFDRVFCCLVLDHIPDTDGFFAELGRLCRPDGFVAVSVMHPAMTLRGVQARFTDPLTGQKIGPASHPHLVSDYLTSAVRAGLELQQINELVVNQSLAEASPRAAKYLDWPLLLLMKWRQRSC
jgi:ubiquinone/menaquinone biosynthesis C-methylase UbiE